MTPTSVVVRCASRTRPGTRGGMTAKKPDSTAKTPPAYRVSRREEPAMSGRAVADPPARLPRPREHGVRVGQQPDAPLHLRLGRRRAAGARVDVDQHGLRLGERSI